MKTILKNSKDGLKRRKTLALSICLGLCLAPGMVWAASSTETLLTTQVPAELKDSDGASVNYELGVKLKTSVAGQIQAIRFYKSKSEKGTHTGKIYSATGSLLASVAFVAETASGWQQQALSSPLSIAANTTYVVTVNTGNSFYVATTNGFATAITNGHLSSIAGNNGVYGSVGSMPSSSYKNTNYFRDIVFAASAVNVNPPTITNFTASPSTLAAGQSSTLSWSVSNASTITVNGAAVSGTSMIVTPSTNTTYALVASNSAGSVSKSVAISVTANNSANYFVSPTGSDSNAGTSAAAPWKTIQHAATSAKAGATVSIAAGTYKESITFNVNGTASAPIKFVGAGTQSCTNGNLQDQCPSVIIQGNVSVESDYITLDTVTVSPAGPISSSVYGTDLGGNYDTIVNSLFVNFGATASDQATMIVIEGTFDTVQNCTLRDQNDIDVFHVWGHDHKIVGNYVTNIQEVNYNLNHTDFVQTWLGDSYNILIDSNVVTNSTCQLGNTETDGSTGDHDWTISNNVFANITNPFFSGLPNTRFYNNFFYNVGSNDDYPISFYTNTEAGNQRSSAGSDVANNVFVKCGQPIGNGGDAAPMETNVFVTTDPGYISLTTGAEVSAAPATYVGKGTNESAHVAKDKAGFARPATGAWTIGPYQN